MQEKKNKLIKKIENIDSKYFNDDQKIIAIEVLKKAPEEEVQAYFDFIIMKSGTGFKFDYSPEIAKGRIITLKEDKAKRINVGDSIKKDENKLIIGDNYNALKCLLITHKEKIDLIYIDPPYNKEALVEDGNQSSKEVASSKYLYKDKFGRCGWLNMIKQRLILARDLLLPEGIIFVSIDDSEQAYLKVLMDEIFGESNFVKTLIWQTNTSVMKATKNFRKDHEYVLVYQKKERIELKKDEKKILFQNLDNDPKGNWISTNATYKLNDNSKNTFDIKLPNGESCRRTWKFSRKSLENGEVPLFFQNGNVPRMKVYENGYSKKQIPSTLLSLNNIDIPYSKEGMDSFSVAKNELKSILVGVNKELVDKMTPKPVKLIKWLIKRIPNKNAIVLDFYAGSGTTGQAVMELNKEDNGNRKFILCTNNENNIADSITYERLYRIVKGRDFKTKGKKELIEKHIKHFFPLIELRVINIDDSTLISLDQNFSENLYERCRKGLILLDGGYSKKNLNLYYDLAALNPLSINDSKT